MSLNWNIENIRDYMVISPTGDPDATGQTIYKNGAEGAKTEVLIMFTIAIGMPKITEDNAAEFWTRVHLYEKLIGPFMYAGGGKKYYFTIEDIHRRIGLSTNATPESPTKWRKRVFEEAYNNAVAWGQAELNRIDKETDAA